MNTTLAQVGLVAAGGAVGAVARFLVAVWGSGIWGTRFPWGTLLVNLAGCFIIGLLAALSIKLRWLSTPLWCLLVTGLVGGFTTFSSFGLETFQMLRQQAWLMAGGYIIASFIGGLLLLWLGYSLIPPFRG